MTGVATVDLIAETRAVALASRHASIDYALCGGLAVVAHGVLRTTKDIDILIAQSDLERALEEVVRLGFEFRALPSDRLERARAFLADPTSPKTWWARQVLAAR